MKKLLMTATLSLFAAAAWAQDTTWKFTDNDLGCSVLRNGMRVNVESSAICMSAGWKKKLFFAPTSFPKRENSAAGWSMATNPEKPSDFFLDEYSLKPVDANTIRITLRGTLKAPEAGSSIQHIIWLVPEGIVNGGSIEANEATKPIQKGEAVTGLDDLRKVTIKGPKLTYTFEVVDGPGFSVIDRRESAYAGQPGLMVARYLQPIEGVELSQVLDVKITESAN